MQGIIFITSLVSIPFTVRGFNADVFIEEFRPDRGSNNLLIIDVLKVRLTSWLLCEIHLIYLLLNGRHDQLHGITRCDWMVSYCRGKILQILFPGSRRIHRKELLPTFHFENRQITNIEDLVVFPGSKP